MKIYYKGKIWQNDSDDYSKFLSISYRNNFDLDYFDCNDLMLNESDFDKLYNAICDYSGDFSGIKNETVKRILNKAKKELNKDTSAEVEIIYEIITDKNNNEYGKELLTGYIFPIANNPQTEYFYDLDDDYKLERHNTYYDENLARFKYILTKESVASINEYEQYINIKNCIPDFTRAINRMKYLYNENVFKNKIILKEEEVTIEKQSEITKIMEDIEFILSILKQYNIELYNTHTSEYKQIILGDEDNVAPCDPSKKDLLILLCNINLSLQMSKHKCDTLLNYLLHLIKDYTTKLLNNNISCEDLNINKLDNITTVFLKNKDMYDIETQRNILKKISILYLLIVKFNIDNISINDLEKSYFKDNIKTIVLNINYLYEIGLTKTPINIDIDTNLNIENVLTMIKSIKFLNLNETDIKKLIK